MKRLRWWIKWGPRVALGRCRQWYFHRTAVWFLGGAVHMSTWTDDPRGDEGVTRILITRDWKADAAYQRATPLNQEQQS